MCALRKPHAPSSLAFPMYYPSLANPQVVVEGLRLVLDPSSYPLLVMCNLGRHRTGTLIGCLRKLQHWSLTCVLEEYRRHASSKSRHLNEQFIELFDIDLVQVPAHCPPALRLHPLL